MRKAKNREQREEPGGVKKQEQRCELCGGPDIALAGKMIRGKVKWICYNCYRKG